MSQESMRVAGAVAPQGTVEVTKHEGPLRRQWGRKAEAEQLATCIGGHLSDRLSRLQIPTILDREFWNSLDPATLREIHSRTAFHQPWPMPLASEYARFRRDGDRDQYQDVVFCREDRLAATVLQAAVSDDESWLDEAIDGIVLVCEQSTWCWPAHDDVFAKKGWILADPTRPFLDLGAGEVASLLAYADAILGPRIQQRYPGVRERIRHEVNQRVLTSFLERNDFWWLGYWRDINNWNPWILSNVIISTLLLEEDSERASTILEKAIDSLDRFVSLLPQDGAVDEGYAYWWAGTGRLLDALDALYQASAGDLDATLIDSVRSTIYFPRAMHIDGPWVINVADGPGRINSAQPWQIIYRWAKRVGDEALAHFATSMRADGEPPAHIRSGLGRMLRAIGDPDWRADSSGHTRERLEMEPAHETRPVAVTWYESISLAVFRTSRFVAAAKGGNNDENHNHNDLGEVIVALRGQPLLIDIGKPTYDATTFTERRYDNPVMQSAWHSTVAPRGLQQRAGQDFKAVTTTVPTDAEPTIEFELGEAYGLEPSESWRRRIEVSEQRITITDRWRLTGSSPSSIQFITAGQASVEGSCVRVTAGGQSLTLRPRSDTGAEIAITVDTWHHEDHEIAAVWGEVLTRITVECPEGNSELVTTVEETA